MTESVSHDVHDTDQNEHQRHIQRERKAADHAAEEQRAGVAHEDLGRMEVVDEEAPQGRPLSAAGSSASVVLPQIQAVDGEEDHDRDASRWKLRPSTPSVRLTALTQPTMTNIAKIR